MVSSCRPTPSPRFSSPHSYLTHTTVSCLGVTRSPIKFFGKWQLSRCPYIRPARSSIVFSLRAFCAHSLARSLGRYMLSAFCLCVSSFNFAYSNSSTPLTILSPLCARGPDATNRVPHPVGVLPRVCQGGGQRLASSEPSSVFRPCPQCFTVCCGWD